MPVFSEIDRTLRNITYKHVLSVTLVLVLLSILPSQLRAAMVSIKGDKVNLRAGPGTNYSVTWELGEGYPLKVLERRKSWLKVKDFEGDTGWVYRRLTAHRPHLIVKKEQVNIRKTPTTNGRIIGKANYGVVFTTIKQQHGWAKVKHDSGLVGWIRRDLLWGW